jgi:hypothetical protein
MTKKYYCKISGKEIPKPRVEALTMLEIPQEDWTCIEFAPQARKKGVYVDLDASFIIADNVNFIPLEEVKEEEDEIQDGLTVLDKISGKNRDDRRDE